MRHGKRAAKRTFGAEPEGEVERARRRQCGISYVEGVKERGIRLWSARRGAQGLAASALRATQRGLCVLESRPSAGASNWADSRAATLAACRPTLRATALGL